MGGRGQQRAQIQLNCPLFLLLVADPIQSPKPDLHPQPRRPSSPMSQARPPPPTPTPPSNGTSGQSQLAHTRYSIPIQFDTRGNTSQRRKIVGKGHEFNINGIRGQRHDSHRTLLSGGPRFKESRDSIRLIQFLRDYLSSAGEHEHESTGASCFLCQTLPSCGRSHLAGQCPTTTRVVQR
jgi:hypothetical protein